MVHPPVNRKCRLVDRDDPLGEMPRAAAQPPRVGEPPELVAGSVVEDLRHLLRVIPVAVGVLSLLDSPDWIMYL